MCVLFIFTHTNVFLFCNTCLSVQWNNQMHGWFQQFQHNDVEIGVSCFHFNYFGLKKFRRRENNRIALPKRNHYDFFLQHFTTYHKNHNYILVFVVQSKHFLKWHFQTNKKKEIITSVISTHFRAFKHNK